jgi:Patatin-like phospholipase
MSDPNTIRILEIDGGGERGYFANCWLQKFVTQWGVDPSTLAQQFDVICGTSVGGIMALSLAYGMTPDEMSAFFTVQGPYIFSLSSFVPSWRPNVAAKIALILADIPFYQSSGPTAANYGSGLLSATLQSNFGSATLQNLQTNVIIPSYQNDTNNFVLFSNANVPGVTGQNALISDVGLATGAAPVYLPAWSFGGHSYIDGGIYQNNPAQFGIALGKILKPNANRICVLSIGTGKGEIGFDLSGNTGIPLANNPLSTTNTLSTIVVTVPSTNVLTNGQNVTIGGATATGGINAPNLNITAPITILNSTTFSYGATASATSSVVGGGAGVQLTYLNESFSRNSRKKCSFHPSGINIEQLKTTPIYQEMIRKDPFIESKLNSPDSMLAFDTIQSIFGLFEIASTGGQESVAQALFMESLSAWNFPYYYRFNYNFALDLGEYNTELDNTDSDVLAGGYYYNKANALYNADIDNISSFIGHLTA